MSGLREKKKKNREERILKAAIELFSQKGYESTTMENIAEKSELGVGTLYNYYSSKEKLLLSIIDGKTDENEFDVILDMVPINIESSLMKFMEIYFKSFLAYPKQIWREIVRSTFGREPDLLKLIEKIDSLFINKTTELLNRNKSLLKGNIKAELVSKTIYSILIYHILIYLSNDSAEIDEISKSLMGQISIIIQGVLKHE